MTRQNRKPSQFDYDWMGPVIDGFAACIYAKDRDVRYTYVNREFCRIFSVYPEDSIGKTNDELFSVTPAIAFGILDRDVISSGEPLAREERLVSVDGGPARYFWTTKQPLFADDGAIAGLVSISLELTDYRRELKELAAVKHKLATTLEALPDLMFELDWDGRYLDCHSPRKELLPAPPDQLIGRTLREMLPPDAAEICMRSLREAQEKGLSSGLRLKLELPGGLHWFEISTACKADEGNGRPHFIMLSRDITHQKRVEDGLRERESLLRAVVDNTPVEYWARDRAGFCIMENAQVVRHWGSLLGKTVDETKLDPKDRQKWEDNNRRVLAGDVVDDEIEYDVGGERRIFQNLVAPIWTDGEVVGMVGFNQDITDRKRAEERVAQLALYDPLTMLANRRLMLDRLNHAVATCARHGSHGALLLIDLDNFKTLNDNLGHEMGDRLLVEVGTRLKDGIRKCDTAARLGGDEFVIILENLQGPPSPEIQAEAMARRIQQQLTAPYHLMRDSAVVPTMTHHCTNSIGIALFGTAPLTAEELLRRADTAMYQAKAAGRNTVTFFDPAMQARVVARAKLEADLHQAIEEGHFLLHYQVQVDANRTPVGSEALLRWQHPERGMISPLEFIPLAEETGQIARIGQWVLEQACEQLHRWSRRDATAHLTVAVNVSALQFRLPNFVAQVRSALDRTGAPPDRLVLELTESLLLEDAEDVISRMRALKSLGVQFSLDDFGTGYSSLAYLKKFPLDQLKIDRTFINELLVDPNDAAIARTIIALANSFNLSVVAEGVETAPQLDYLVQLGCHEYQGYLFSRPQPIEQFEESWARSVSAA